MPADELIPHLRERLRDRVTYKLAQSDATINTKARDIFVQGILLLADEPNRPQAADLLFELKRTELRDSISFEQAKILIAKTQAQFAQEISIVSDLYQMQEKRAEIKDILAQLERRFA